MDNITFGKSGLPDHPMIKKAFFKLEFHARKAAREIQNLSSIAACRPLSDIEKNDLTYYKSLNLPAAYETVKILLRHEPSTSPQVIAAFLANIMIEDFDDITKFEDSLGKNVSDLIAEAALKSEDPEAFALASKNVHLLSALSCIYYFSAPQINTSYDIDVVSEIKDKFKNKTRNVRAFLLQAYPALVQEIDIALEATLKHFNNLSRMP